MHVSFISHELHTGYDSNSYQTQTWFKQTCQNTSLQILLRTRQANEHGRYLPLEHICNRPTDATRRLLLDQLKQTAFSDLEPTIQSEKVTGVFRTTTIFYITVIVATHYNVNSVSHKHMLEMTF